MWFSPKWRMAAMLAILVLAGVDAVSGHIVAWQPAAQNRAAADTVRAVEMAAREAGLTPADTGALVAQAIAATRPPRITSLNEDTLFQRSNR
jgi:3-oxoacyl-(acyl-carrier-protein) synthase